jgi:hypothetical protein
MKNVTPPGPIVIIELVALVDELAALKATIEPLQAREEAIKDALKATGRDRIDGTAHTAVIVLSEPMQLDKDRLKADLGEELYASYTFKGKLSVACRLTARKTH